MNSQVLIAGFLWGTLLGFFYFGGLWFTVQRVPGSRRPKRLLFVSFIVRVATVMTGFWFILQQDPLLFVVTLLFFFLVRVVISRLLGRSVKGDAHAH